MMLGYWDKPEDTAAALKDGWVHSADLGRVRDDGYLQLTGRTKELYKSGGELVMPKEIEELLAGLPVSARSTSSACPTSGGARSAARRWCSSPARPRPSTR